MLVSGAHPVVNAAEREARTPLSEGLLPRNNKLVGAPTTQSL